MDNRRAKEGGHGFVTIDLMRRPPIFEILI